MKTLSMHTPTASATIYLGEDAIQRLTCLTQGQRNFVLTDSNVYALYPAFFQTYFSDAEIFVLPAGEEHKTFESLYSILSKMAGAGMRRTSRLFAVGGGVIGDIGGLAAALYMRGVSCVQIPTTLLAQVDSSVGGKTAVDLDGVKNIVGAFYQPCEVLVDPSFLRTLPIREMKSGLGEIVKYAALNADIFDTLQTVNTLDDLGFLTRLIEQSILHKIGVVERDEKELGERKSLNVGHTTGHAIELYYHLSHGESVLYGMWIETKIAIEQKVCEANYGEELLKIVTRALHTQPVSMLDLSKISDALVAAKSDKKNVNDGKIRMSVAKQKGCWTELALDYDDYVSAVVSAVKCLEGV